MLSATRISISDPFPAYVVRSNEEAGIFIYLRNNSLEDIQNLSVVMSTDFPGVEITEATGFLPFLQTGEETAIPLHFSLETGTLDQSVEIQLRLEFFSDTIWLDAINIPFFLGDADILLVQDEEHLYKNRANSIQYYQNALDQCGKSVRTLDINQVRNPPHELFQHFEAVFWETGLDNEVVHSIFNLEEQLCIEAFLLQGGKLFICSQNASEALLGTSFCSNYFHAVQLQSDYAGTLVVVGDSTHSVGEGFSFSLNGGDGSNSVYSASVIEPTPDAINLFKYLGTELGAGIAFDGNYQLVFLPFCLAAIDNEADRNELVSRVLQFFHLSNQVSPVGAQISNRVVVVNPIRQDQLLLTRPAEKAMHFSIFSATGLELYHNQIEQEQSLVNIPHLTSGFYVLRLWDEQESQSLVFQVIR